MKWNEWDKSDRASVWFLGQSGFFIKSCGCSVLADPYLSDSVGEDNPLYSRIYPVPAAPEELNADFFVVTHDHMDHLDPVTISRYTHKDTTIFIAPRQAARRLITLGISECQIRVVDQGESICENGVVIEGVFALGTGPDVLDTTGYRIEFPNKKSVYHTSDTSYCDLLLKACPDSDVLLVCINGKFGNLTVEEAVKLTLAVNPSYVIPHHYDMMALNSENPEAFRYFCTENNIGNKCVILSPMENFEW